VPEQRPPPLVQHCHEAGGLGGLTSCVRRAHYQELFCAQKRRRQVIVMDTMLYAPPWRANSTQNRTSDAGLIER
jgi:hypothetical protein